MKTRKQNRISTPDETALSVIPQETIILVRQKMDMTAQVIDAMLLGPIVASMGPIMTALGLQTISTQAILMRMNDTSMKSFLNCVVLILQAAQDEAVEANEFGEKLIDAANELNRLFSREKA